MKERYKLILKTSIIGIVANIILAAFKALIGFLSNSIAITLDAVNNLTDAISSIITIIGAHFSSKDPDKKHPFGYGRTEYLSTLAIAIIILYAGVTAFVESLKCIIHPKTPDYNYLMLGVLLVAVVVKIGLGLLYSKRGKEINSDSLKASGKDALFDSLISTATIVAAGVYILADISLESYLGIIISVIIVKSGVEILKETISKILGEGASVELVKAVKKSISAHEGVLGAYDLVFNNYGQDIYMASVHIEVPDDMTADEIDVLIRRITRDVHDEFNIYLTAIGLYSHSNKAEVTKLRKQVETIVLSHDYVNQIHGFYVNTNDKEIRFDMVISFDAPSRAELYEHVMGDLKKEFADYEISAGMDADFNEI